MSVSMRHIKVLFKKDMLTLRRNWSFLLMFVILPLAMMSAFGFLSEILAGKFMPEQHNFQCKCLLYFISKRLKISIHKVKRDNY